MRKSRRARQRQSGILGRGVATILVVVVCGAATPGESQTLYGEDGVQLRVSFRVTTHEAGHCQVSESAHSTRVYELLKEHRGRPLHVWRVEISAHNESPREVSYLRAHVNIESPWPPCDDWEEESGGSPDPVSWGDELLGVNVPDGLMPGEQVGDTVFLAVLDGEIPAVGLWDIHSVFADETSGPGARRSASSATDPPGKRAVAALAGIEFMWIPAGEFRMGSVSSFAPANQAPVTNVRIGRGFWLGKHEVTQQEWQAVMGSAPSAVPGCARCPVDQVSWGDVQEFIGRANALGARRYRLPTEAEWEYAARAGTTDDWWNTGGALCQAGNVRPVGLTPANAWGLHDMLGNSYEWVEDRYGDHPGGAVTDPRGPAAGSLRVQRGGGHDTPGCVRAPYRHGDEPTVRLPFLGFRLVRTH